MVKRVLDVLAGVMVFGGLWFCVYGEPVNPISYGLLSIGLGFYILSTNRRGN